MTQVPDTFTATALIATLSMNVCCRPAAINQPQMNRKACGSASLIHVKSGLKARTYPHRLAPRAA